MKKTTTESPLERQFLGLWKTIIKAENPERQYQFHPKRKWRIDFAWPAQKLAVEIDGGTHGKAVRCHQCGVKVRAIRNDGFPGKELRIGGGHNRGKAHLGQYEKQNALAEAGWTVLRYCSQDLQSDPVGMLETIWKVLQRLTPNDTRKDYRTKLKHAERLAFEMGGKVITVRKIRGEYFVQAPEDVTVFKTPLDSP